MESALATLILISLLLFAVLTLSHSYLDTQNALIVAEQEMQTRMADQGRTDLAVVQTQVKNAGAIIEVTLRNTGDVKLADFNRWDVIVEYYQDSDDPDDPDTYYIRRLAYSPDILNDNQWQVAGIYANTAALAPEVFDPGILNPGEELIVQMSVLPPVGPDTTNRATVGVANGVTASTYFTWQ